MTVAERTGKDRGYPDTRRLPPPPATAQLRFDPLVGEWVAINAHQQERTFLPPERPVPTVSVHTGLRQ